MTGRIGNGILAFVIALMWSAAGAWAQARVVVTREESQPRSVAIRAGEEVEFFNASGGVAHVWFGRDEGVRFYIGREGARVTLEKPGTDEYTVHVTATKAHSHTGTVVVTG